jgi:transcriptional activator of cad operon
MVKFQIGDFLLDKQLSILSKNEVETVVEPRLLELLLLFCQHPNRIISREEILEKIWQNSIVTDNAINKMIGNLRKLLLDDPKTPRYIQTVPKRGYRLICSVDIVSNIPIASQTKPLLNEYNKEEFSVHVSYKKHYAYWFLITCIFSVLLVVILKVSGNKTAFTISKTQELTRQQGLEFSALHSENESIVLFLKKVQINGISQLWRKNLSSNQESLIGTHDLNIFKLIAIYNESEKNSQKLLFIASKNKQCFIYKADWSSNKELINIESVMDCTSMAINDIAFDTISKQLIYSALKANDQTSRIYRYELSSKKHFLMAQPEPLGIGNHNVDISPDGKKLLIMRSNNDLHTQLFVLTLKSNEIKEYQKFNYFVREAIWHHDSDNILYFPPPPAHQILMGDLAGKNSHTVVSISEYLSRNMSLISDGESLLFATNLADYSNRWLTGNNKGRLLDNSTVYEMLPALLSDNKHYLYISKRSGKSQLYMGDFASGSSKVLTQLENYLVFKYISVAPDNNSVLLATNNRVWQLPLKALIEGRLTLKSLDNYQIFHADGFIKALNWMSSSVVSLTYKNENRLQLSLVDLKTRKELKLDHMWSYAVSENQKNENVFLINSIDHSVYQIGLSKLLASPLSNAKTSKNHFIQTDMKLSTKFKQLKVFQERLYFIDDSSRNVKLSSLPWKGEQHLESYKIMRSYGYDVSSLGILLNELVSREGDIHRTLP